MDLANVLFSLDDCEEISDMINNSVYLVDHKDLISKVVRNLPNLSEKERMINLGNYDYLNFDG